MNAINPDGKYTQMVKFFMDFHTPKDTGDMTFNPDSDYNLPQDVIDRTIAKYKEAYFLLTGKEFAAEG